MPKLCDDEPLTWDLPDAASTRPGVPGVVIEVGERVGDSRLVSVDHRVATRSSDESAHRTETDFDGENVTSNAAIGSDTEPSA